MMSYMTISENNKDKNDASQDIGLLAGCSQRIQLILEATRDISLLQLNSNLEKFNKDAELALIIKNY